MAILKGINGGNFSGSVGKVTFRKGLKGEVIASQKAENVANPKTTPQQEQRMLMKTVITAYSALKNVCSNSFEGVQQGQKSQSEFIRRNLKLLRTDIDTHAFTKYNVGGVAPNQYLISKGNINGVQCIFEDSKFKLANNGISLSLNANNNWGFFKKLYNLKGGESLLIVSIYSNNDDLKTWDVTEQEDLICDMSKYIFAENISDEEKIITDSYTINDNLFASKNIGLASFSSSPADSSIRITTDNPNAHLWMIGIVVSRKVGNKWQHSTSYMVKAGSVIPAPYKYDNVLQSYSPSGTKYLNNATI